MTPSQTIMRQVASTDTVVDGKGRRLTIRRLTALDTLRLLKAAGPVMAQNEAWLAMAGLVFAVVEIDGVPVPAPVTETQIENLVDRLDDVGLEAIAHHLKGNGASEMNETVVGNLQRTPL
jgi:hypothetical protein